MSTYNSVLSPRIKRLYGFQPSRVVLCMQISGFSTWITSLCWSQPSSVVLHSEQRLLYEHTSLYGFQTSTVALCIQKAWLAPELLVSMFSSLHLWSFAFKTATLGEKLQVSMGPRPHMWFSACKTACLASELLVSMGPSPHVWFLDAKQRDLRQNDKSIRVPALIRVFLMCETATLGPELQVCMGPRPQLWFWAHITACLAQE